MRIIRSKEAGAFSSFWDAELGDRIVSRSGPEWRSRSPFRTDANPSVSVNVQSGLYQDFAEPGGMNTISFLERMYGLTFTESVHYLRANYGLDWNTVFLPSFQFKEE